MSEADRIQAIQVGITKVAARLITTLQMDECAEDIGFSHTTPLYVRRKIIKTHGEHNEALREASRLLKIYRDELEKIRVTLNQPTAG